MNPVDAMDMHTTGEAVGTSRLTDLPPELLSQIIEYLIPEPPEIGETRPVTYDKLAAGELWYDITRNRHGLRSLCLTSRGLYAMAQPLLYRIISIVDEEGMVLLFRTLIERPELCYDTRYFSCHLTLTRIAVISDTKRAITRLVNTFNPDYLLLRRDHAVVDRALRILFLALPNLSARAGDFDDVPQILLFYVLTFMKKLETLLLQLPVCEEHPEYTALFDKFAAPNMSSTQTGGHSKETESSVANSELPLQHVRTLLLQGDPEVIQHFEADTCNCNIPDIWGVQIRRYWPVFKALPALTTLEVSADDGIWTSARHRQPDGSRPPYLETVQHLYLHNSFASPRDLNNALANAPALTTLYMTPRRYDDLFLDDDLFDGPEDESHPESLDAALLSRRRQLRHLDIGWMTCAGNEALIGDGGRLKCLPSMVRLDKLCVQLAVLYGTDAANLLTPMIDLLPPNLAELTLEEYWWEDLDTYEQIPDWHISQMIMHYRDKREYRAQALAILERLAEDLLEQPGRMPKLRRVTFQVKIPWTWKFGGCYETASHFEEVRDLFAERRVGFLVEEV